jgi:lipopolysaccharide/colanic/teichoic acid biosynthesis glycosyltransferase
MPHNIRSTYSNNNPDLLAHLERHYGKHDVVRQIGQKAAIMRLLLSWKTGLAGKHIFKRSLDIAGALFFLILLAPLFLLTSLAILIEDGRPIFYNQTRVSRGGRLFRMFKFRSMFNNADELKKTLQSDESTGSVIFKMKNDPRITRSGKVIRKLSIDELPQLWNVLIGDLSLVGPRPPLPDEVAAYSAMDVKRLTVTPGLTCIWQVSGRSDIDFENQVLMDIDYIKQRTPMTDLKLLLKTIPAVLSGKGAY